MKIEKLTQKIDAVHSSKKRWPGIVEQVFSILQEGLAFHVGWFFLVDLKTKKRIEDSLQYWSGPSSQIETGPLYLDEDFFPSVAELENQGCLSVRGTEHWQESLFIKHPLYQKVLKSEGLFFSLISLVKNEAGECVGYFVFWKKRSQGEFLDEDLRCFSSLSSIIGKVLYHHAKVGDRQPDFDAPRVRPEARLLSPVEKVSGISEEELYSLIRRRAQPGILILDQESNILYLNHDGKIFLEGLTSKSSIKKMAQSEKTHGKRDDSLPVFERPLPEIIYQLYEHFSRMMLLRKNETEGSVPTVNRICIHEGMVYLLRALLLEQPPTIQNGPHFMILIERVSQGVRVDQIDWTVKLTPREQEVVQLLLEGKTNKEVAVCIDIGEYTVKDHIKRIMKKLEVTTRAGIVAKVLQHHFPT